MNSSNIPHYQNISTQLFQSRLPSFTLSSEQEELSDESKELITPLETAKKGKTQVTSNEFEGKKPWNEEEELNMIVAHYKYKNRWSEISSVLKGRNNNTVKNRFYSIFRRIKGKIQRGDCKYSSKLELLEIYYILSLIEQYLNNPTSSPKTKGKRGKDFIYSLVHNVSQQTIKNYKELLHATAKHEGTMDELLVQLIAKSNCAAIFKQVIPQVKPKTIVERPVEVAFDTTGKEELHIEKDSAEVNKEGEAFNKQLNYPELDISLAFEIDIKSPVPFSSPLISAGAATIVARAHKAPCFNDICFSDLSTMTKNYLAEETAKDEMLNLPEKDKELKSNLEGMDGYKSLRSEFSSNEYY